MLFSSKKGKLIFRLSVALVIFAVTTLVGSLVYIKINIHGKFPPKTFVAGVDISSKTFNEAGLLIEKKGEQFSSKSITVVFKGVSKQLNVKDLKPKLFIPQTLNTIEETDGRNFGIIDLFFPKEYEQKNSKIITSIDEEYTWSGIDKMFNLTELEPKSATFKLNNKGVLEIIPEHAGIVVNKTEVLKLLKERISSLDTAKIEIKEIPATPLIKSTDLETQKESLSKKLKYSVILEDPIYSDDWKVKLKDHLDWVSFSEGENYCLPLITDSSSACDPKAQEKVQLRIKEEPFNAFIDAELSKWLDKPAQDVEIKEDPDSKNKALITGHGDDGHSIQRAELRSALELAINSEVSKVKIPVTDLPPQITVSEALKAKGIKEKLAVGHTSYYGSPANRVYNIKVASAKLNGTIIAPGETFSFNGTLGPVDSSTGYRKELVIKKEGTIPEYGGGVCQMSTTVYRSALFSGLPIVERNEHSYAVSYYSQILGHGLDATIYIGGANLRFTNDTGNSLVMQTYVDPDYELYVVLYGTSDGRSVKMDGPYVSSHQSPPPTVYEETTELAPGQTKESEHAHAGFKVLWYRYLTNKDGTTKTEEIRTSYKAMPAKILIGKAATPDPVPSP